MKRSTLKALEPARSRRWPAMGVPVAGTAGGAAYAVPRAAPAVLGRVHAGRVVRFRSGRDACCRPKHGGRRPPPRADGRGARRRRVADAGLGRAARALRGAHRVQGRLARCRQLPGGGPALTEWHPVIDATTGRWRFPNMRHRLVMRKCAHVVNFLLEGDAPEHVILVDGTQRRHARARLQARRVAHEYWGTDAVVRDLERREGWAAGRVVMEAK